jgi:GntR family transcriptional regulator, transcriptional repressor for pyruvate dehydrogenase complex
LEQSAVALRPVSRQTLSEQVAMQLAGEIQAQRWKPGEKLPSEAELCRAFGVGRSTLREALKSLAFIGMIRMRAGGGSYVAEQPSKYLSGPWLAVGVLTSEQELNDFAEARLVLEAELAGFCAERASDDDIKVIESLVNQMSGAIREDGGHFSELDLSFHLAIGAGSKNQVLAELLKHVRERLRELITKSLLLPAGMELACKQHRQILDALKSHNSAKAREAMRSHLRAFQRGYKVLFRTTALEDRTMAPPNP